VADDLDIPPFQQRRLDETAERGSTDEPGEFVNVDVQFAYAILRPDGKRRVDVQANDVAVRAWPTRRSTSPTV